MNLNISEVSGCSGRTFYINWALFNSCNYRCAYCHPDLHEGSIQEPSYEIVAKFIKEVLSNLEEKGVTPYFEFGGGEVTLLRYFEDIIKLIYEHDGLVTIVSNGSKNSPGGKTMLSIYQVLVLVITLMTSKVSLISLRSLKSLKPLKPLAFTSIS